MRRLSVAFFALVALAATATGRQMNRMHIKDNDIGLMAIEQMSRDYQADQPIPAVAEQLGLTDLVKLVKEAGLAETLSGAGPFTVFGPVNKAFAHIPKWLKKYISDPKNLAQLLTYHVLSGVVKSINLSDELVAKTVSGKTLRVNLYPKGQQNFNVATVQCAPIDLKQVDEEASNGVIHVINKVMIPPYGALAASLSVGPGFTNLTAALKLANLFDTLNGAGPFTVFAPTDEAFSKLPAGALDKLLKNTTALTEVLTYHVVSGTYCSAGLTSGPVKTLNTKEVNVQVRSSGVRVNGIRVIMADGSVTNGVVHVINRVLLPPSFCV